MAGVMSLMQPQGQQGPMPGQVPMPGQAPMQQMPGMMPQQGAATPAAMVGPLTQMHMQQLVQLMLNPRPDGPPLYAVLSALSEKQKAAKAAQAMQGQQVIAQNQQMQQQPPVAAQVVQAAAQMQDPLMAAYGGETQGYAGGGAVAFRNGGDPEEERLRQQIREMFGSAASPLNILGPRAGQERERAQEIMRMLPSLDKEQMRNILGVTQRAVDPNAYQEFGPGERRESRAPFEADMARLMSPYQGTGRNLPNVMARPVAAAPESPSASAAAPTTFDITNPASINALRIAAQDTSLPEAERADLRRRIAMMEGNRPAQSGVATLVRPQATLTPEEEQSYANRASTLRTRQGLPEDVLAGRQGIATLAAENLAAQRAEREQLALEAKEQRDAALARSQRNIMNDPMSLLALAGSIDTRRGQGVGSLARGAAGLLGKREEQAEAARKEFSLAQRDQRMLQANERQANMLEMQRQQAIRENDFTRVSQIEDQLAALEVQKSQLLRSRQEHAEKMALDERRVGAAELDAAAKFGRPTEIDFFRQDPEGYARFQAAKLGPRNEPKAMTYDQAADNVSKFLDTTAGMMEISNIRKQAKAANQPEPSLTQIRDMLIQRELQGAGARTSAPLGGKVMTMADVQATATASGKTVDEVRKAATAAGYTIQ